MSTSGNPTALPNFAQLFTADPTYKNFMGLNQQFNELTNAFGRGNSPFSLQDIQGAASAFQQAIQPYAQQFQERSGQEVLAQRAAAQQQQQDQLRSQMQNALGPGAVIQGNVIAPVSPFQQQAAPIPLNQSPLSSATPLYTNTRSTFSQSSPYGSSYGSSYGSTGGGFGGNQNVIPLEGRFGLVRLARGGEVSEARRMLQNLQNPVQRFADGNEVKKTSVDQAAQDFIKATGAVNPAQAQSRAELDAMIAANAPAKERALADPLMAYNSEFQTQFLPRALEAGLTAQQALEKFAQDKTAAFGTSVRYPSNNTVMPQLQGFIDAVNSGNAGDATKFASRAGMLGVNYNDFLNMAESASPGVSSTMYEKFYDPNSEFSKQGKTFWPDLANLFQGGSPNPWSVIREIKPKTGLTDEQIGYALGITGDDVKDAFQGKLVTLPPFGGAQAGGTQAGGTQAGGTQTGGAQAGSTTSAVTILPPTTALPELTGKFTQEVAPPPEAPPPALTPGQEGLNPSTAIVGAIPQSERVTTPQLDTQFRASAPRTATYDRFGRITGYNYSPAAKLTPATGTNVFNFVPPGITSRPRSLLNLGDVPGVTVDPVTGQMRLPLSASQQFARDRSELDTAIRELYRRKSATDSSVPSTIPAPAAEAFRQLAMTDPSLSKQIRYRDISQDVYDPTKADASLRAQFGRPQAEAALTKAFDPFFERNRTALTSLAKDITASKSYSEMYPDIAAAYDKLSAAEKAKFPTLQDYERYHFDTYGKNEGRVSPLELMAKANPLRGPYTTSFFSKGGEASTEDFIKKQSGGDVSRGTASPNTAEVPQVDTEGRLIDEREEIRSESQRMLNRLQSQPSKLPPGLRRTIAATKEQGKESMIPAAAPARDLLSGILGASPTAPGSEAYRTGQAIANMPPVQAAAAIPAKIAASAGDAATALAAMGPAMGAVIKPKGGNWLANAISDEMQNLKLLRFGNDPVDTYEDMKNVYTPEVMSRLSPETLQQVKEGFAALKPQVAINKWIDSKLAKYMQNEFATPEDPVRALIERGISPARNPGDINPIYDYNNVFEKRKKAGFPVEGLAETEAGRNWEEMADSSVNVSYLKNLLSSLKEGQESKYAISRVEANRTLRDNPWLSELTLPDTPIYGALGANYRPVFNHVIDELQNAMATNSGLPKNLQLDPDDLSKMNVPQVVELVDKINKWRVDNIKNLQLEETLKADLYKVYPEKNYRWVQLNRPGQFAAESDAMGHSVRGYEPPGKGGDMYYGLGGFKAIQSGEAKVYSLRDEKGQPHVTIEVSAAPGAMSPSEFYHSDLATQSLFDRLDKVDEATINRDKSSWWEEVVRESPEYQEYLKTIPSKVTQIKGKGNEAPVKKYWAFAQDFVKSGNWSDVQDLHNIGLRKTSSVFNETDIAKLKAMGENVPNYVAADDIRRFQDLVIPEKMRLKYDDAGNVIGYKHGGPVNVPRETSTSKQQLDKLAQVSQRKKA